MASEYPTCSTCPFWDREDEDMEVIPVGHPDRDGWAECHRNAPVGRMERDGGPLFAESLRHSYAWPWTAASEFCGEHPDFPAFLAARADAREV